MDQELHKQLYNNAITRAISFELKITQKEAEEYVTLPISEQRRIAEEYYQERTTIK